MTRAFRLRRRPNPNYHILGDSTATVINQRNNFAGDYTAGPGSTQSGAGYTVEAPTARIPLTPPGAPIVVGFVSLWDSVNFYDPGVRDFSGYSEAYDYYASFGVEQVWVEAQFLYPAFGGDITNLTELAEFNAAIAAELGVTLVSRELRENIELQVDDLHPTVQGAKDLVDRVANLVGTRVSRLRGNSDASGLRGTGVVVTAASALTGVGTATAASRKIARAAAALTGVGTVVAAARKISRGSAALTGAAAAVAAGRKIARASSTLTGVGSVAASASRVANSEVAAAVAVALAQPLTPAVAYTSPLSATAAVSA